MDKEKIKMEKQIKELKEEAIRIVADSYNCPVEKFTDRKDEKVREEVDAKFAELIIRACANVVFKNTGPKSALNVLENFGIKE